MATAIQTILNGKTATAHAHDPQQLKARLMSDLITTQTLEDQLHWVCPVILIVEGVHNNLYYPAEELEKFPEAWNGSPLPIFHPEDDHGNFMTANDPQVVERQNAGIFFNVRFEEGKLKGEAWIHQEKARDIAPEMVSLLNSGQEVLEVSTGLYLEVIQESGDFNGVKYDGIAINYRPDHLALLPGGIGACSVADGAGLPRVNQQQEDDDVATRKKTHEAKRNEFVAKFSDKLDKMFASQDVVMSIGAEVIGNELSHNDVRRQIEGMVEKFTDKLRIDRRPHLVTISAVGHHPAIRAETPPSTR